MLLVSLGALIGVLLIGAFLVRNAIRSIARPLSSSPLRPRTSPWSGCPRR